MKRKMIDKIQAEKRKLTLVKASDAAYKLDAEYDNYKEEIIPYKDIYQMLGVSYPPKNSSTNGRMVQLINEAFDKEKLKSRLFVVKDLGAKLYARGDEVIMLYKQRKMKEFNAVKRTNDLFIARLEAHPTGKWAKFINRQIKVQSIIAETQASYLELDEVFEADETAKMMLSYNNDAV